MVQIARSFDSQTIQKIKRSALISLAGFLLTAIPLLLTDASTALADKPTVVAALGAFGGFIVSTIREWLRGAST